VNVECLYQKSLRKKKRELIFAASPTFNSPRSAPASDVLTGNRLEKLSKIFFLKEIDKSFEEKKPLIRQKEEE
jgi:hypothetical protein